jgi:hypothetical protein
MGRSHGLPTSRRMLALADPPVPHSARWASRVLAEMSLDDYLANLASVGVSQERHGDPTSAHVRVVLWSANVMAEP